MARLSSPTDRDHEEIAWMYLAQYQWPITPELIMFTTEWLKETRPDLVEAYMDYMEEVEY